MKRGPVAEPSNNVFDAGDIGSLKHSATITLRADVEFSLENYADGGSAEPCLVTVIPSYTLTVTGPTPYGALEELLVWL